MLPHELAGRPLCLAIAGDGPLRDSLHQQAAELGIAARVHWLGWQAEPAQVYRAADIFVCPSRHEPLGNVILEAWAQGVPVVSSRSQGARELIEDGVDGVLAPIADAPALAGVLRAVIGDQTLCNQLVVNARHKLEQQFSEAKIVGDYSVLYQQLLGAQR